MDNDYNSKHSQNTNNTTHSHNIHISITVPGVVVISIVLTGSVELSVGSKIVKLFIIMVDIVTLIPGPSET